jgi:hypothetical protein
VKLLLDIVKGDSDKLDDFIAHLKMIPRNFICVNSTLKA